MAGKNQETPSGEHKMAGSLTGLIAAPYTPMHEDGSINLDVIPKIADLLRQDGVSGAFVCGTTGEGASLTTDERRRVTETWASVCDDDLALIVHVGHNSLEEARSLASHAQSVGAHAIAALAPSYFKPTTVDALVAICRSIADAAPDLPFFYYHIPSMTGVTLSMPAFLKAAGPSIPSLAGIKYSTSDLMQFRQCAVLENGRYTMFFGSDEMLLGAMAMGAKAAVGSTYNYAAPNYVRMMQAFQAGDTLAAQMHAQHAVALVEVLLRYGVLQAGKAIMGMRGVDCGPVRLPLAPLTSDKTAQLFKELIALPIFESVSLIPPTG